MKNLQDLIQQTLDWNVKVGNKTHPAYTMEFEKAFELQSKLVLEEAQETYDSALVADYLEMLDGACDALFTLAQNIQLLESAGFDFEGAYQAVIDSNMKKVFNSFYEACSAKEKLEERDDVEYFVETNVHNGLPFYVILRQDGKVMKPVDFEKVSLEKFLPQGG